MKALKLTIAAAFLLTATHAWTLSIQDLDEKAVVARTFADEDHNGKPDGDLVELSLFRVVKQEFYTAQYFKIEAFLSDRTTDLKGHYKTGDVIEIRSAAMSPYAHFVSSEPGRHYIAFLRRGSGGHLMAVSLKIAPLERKSVLNLWTDKQPEPLERFVARVRKTLSKS